MSNLQIVRNDASEIVYLAGLLPDDTTGICIDEEEPFTDDELRNPTLFAEHRKRLATRVDKRMKEQKGD